MSQNFSVLLSAPLSELGPPLIDMAKRLRQHGFHHDATLVRLELGEDIDAPETEIPFHLGETRIDPSWNGVSTSFFFPSGLILDVIICRWQSEFLNIYVETPIRVLADIHQRARMNSLYFIPLTEIAAACKCAGGIGGYSLDPEPISPSNILTAILNNPFTPGSPADLGLVPTTMAPRANIERVTGSTFRIEEILGYWLLTTPEFETRLSFYS